MIKDNDIDQLSKEAVSKYNPSFYPDWPGMKSLLDTHLPVKERRKRWIMLITLLTLLFVGGYCFFTGKEASPAFLPIAVPQIAKNELINTEKPNFKKDQSHLAIKVADKSEPLKLHAGNDRTEDELASLTNGIHDHWYWKRIHIKSPSLYTLNEPEREVLENPINKASSQNNKMVENNNFDRLREAEIKEINKKESLSQSNPMPMEDSVIHKHNEIPDLFTATNNNLQLPDNNPQSKQSGLKKAKRSSRDLEIKFVYAPDLTTVKFKHFMKPGSNFGLLIDWWFSGKFGVQTGYINTRKYYLAEGSDFTLPYPVSSGYKLQNVEGWCHMFELPLNLQVRVLENPNFNLTINTGLSSYFMKKQYYDYYYSWNSTPYEKNYIYTDKSNYWMGVINAGFSFQKRVGDKFSLGFSPYMKFPLRGMGTGNVRLTSMGTYFSLAFRPGKGMKK